MLEETFPNSVVNQNCEQRSLKTTRNIKNLHDQLTWIQSISSLRDLGPWISSRSHNVNVWSWYYKQRTSTPEWHEAQGKWRQKAEVTQRSCAKSDLVLTHNIIHSTLKIRKFPQGKLKIKKKSLKYIEKKLLSTLLLNYFTHNSLKVFSHFPRSFSTFTRSLQYKTSIQHQHQL